MLGSSHHREERPASAARERDRFAVEGGEPSVCLVARFLLLDVADNVQESRTRRVPIRFAGRGPLWWMYRIMSPYYARRAEVLHRLETLTPRERQVMDMVVDGAANKVIAIDLNLSERTVEIHRAKVMEKMGARSVAHLVRLQLTLTDDAQP